MGAAPALRKYFRNKHTSQRGKILSLPCPGTGSSCLATFSCVQHSRVCERWALCLCLPNHPTRAWEGEDQKPGERDQVSCPDLLRAVLEPYHAMGQGWMGTEDGWRKIRTCWESTSSLEQDLWVVPGQIRTDIFPIKSENPHIGMRSCQNASSSLHDRGASSLEVWCRIFGGGGEMFSLANNERLNNILYAQTRAIVFNSYHIQM